MEKTRDLFKKIRDTKGTFHAKMGSIKDRSSMDLAEAEDIKKRPRPEQPLGRGSALPRLGAELELRRSGSSLGPSQ